MLNTYNIKVIIINLYKAESSYLLLNKTNERLPMTQQYCDPMTMCSVLLSPTGSDI